ncbi:MAG TPA: methyltransferase domain-containing protein [Candidatus Binataceae bacterium]|nr:methyltransferase domain-containing protein [Candidatus Binataceae bacterium]
MSDWEPELYNRFRRYRAEPVDAILARLPISDDARIADLGCGTGENTIELTRRSVHARVCGIDLSPAMIDAAEKIRSQSPAEIRDRVTFQVGNIAELDSSGVYSIIFSNAALQWIPNHRRVLARWFGALAPGGRMVVQMPANDRETAKVELGKLALEEPWRAMLDGVGVSFREVPPPERYQKLLAEIGFGEIDCHYLTFHHPMQSPSEVVEWYRATGLRPFIEALPQGRRPAFLDALRQRLERAYGTTGPVTFDFKRLFIWARRPAA